MAPRLLNEEEIGPAVAATGWTREGDEIVKKVELADFKAAMAFVNQVADLAEARDHHPDIAVSWNKVELRLSTHSAGGLTDLDFELAGAVDALGAGG
jgi:4a-hydroxytetrahydrobiopterin dehydratase